MALASLRGRGMRGGAVRGRGVAGWGRGGGGRGWGRGGAGRGWGGEDVVIPPLDVHDDAEIVIIEGPDVETLTSEHVDIPADRYVEFRTHPNTTMVALAAFRSQRSLRRLDLRNVTVVQDRAFEHCSNLQHVVAPHITDVGVHGFMAARNTECTFAIDNVTWARVGLDAMPNMTFTNTTMVITGTIQTRAFRECTGIDILDLHPGAYLDVDSFVSVFLINKIMAVTPVVVPHPAAAAPPRLEQLEQPDAWWHTREAPARPQRGQYVPAAPHPWRDPVIRRRAFSGTAARAIMIHYVIMLVPVTMDENAFLRVRIEVLRPTVNLLQTMMACSQSAIGVLCMDDIPPPHLSFTNVGLAVWPDVPADRIDAYVTQPIPGAPDRIQRWLVNGGAQERRNTTLIRPPVLAHGINTSVHDFEQRRAASLRNPDVPDINEDDRINASNYVYLFIRAMCAYPTPMTLHPMLQRTFNDLDPRTQELLMPFLPIGYHDRARALLISMNRFARKKKNDNGDDNGDDNPALPRELQYYFAFTQSKMTRRD